MRNGVAQTPDPETGDEPRRLMRIAVRQLERADLYLSTVSGLEIDDQEAQRKVDRLRADLEDLRRHIVDERNRLAL